MKTVLVCAAHGDDEILGVGGSIARYSNAGCFVCVCIATKPWEPDWTKSYIKNKELEIIKAHQVLDVKKTEFFGLKTVLLDTTPFKHLCDAFIHLVRKYEPDIMYIPHRGDLNLDHRIVHDACLVAARPRQDVPIPKLLAYETLTETEWGTAPFVPNYYVNISDTIETKLKAMKAYASELKPPRTIENIKAAAKKRGAEVNVKFAEAFLLIREVT